MAGRRSRKAGDGMVPLFDVEAFARDDGDARALSPRHTASTGRNADTPAVAPSASVDYWVRGVFRHGDGQRTRTVHAVGIGARLDADVARFVRYLTDEGFQFAEGRGYLIELLGVGADDGVQISLTRGGS